MNCKNLANVTLTAENIFLEGGIAEGILEDVPFGTFLAHENVGSLKVVTLCGNLKEIDEYTFNLYKGQIPRKENVISNSNVTIKCTGGVDAFKAACPDPNDPTKVGLSSWEQVQAI